MASSLAVKAAAPRFPPLPSLRDFLYMYRLNATKALSQNYLMDMNLTRKICNKVGDMSDAFVLEIGPGPGGITRAIIEHPCRRLDVVEIDRQFRSSLEHLSQRADDRMHMHMSNILKLDVEQLWTDAGASKCSWHEKQPPFHIIGNLPFHIATPLIIKYLREMSVQRGPFAFGRVPLTFTLQSEVAKRVVGLADTEFRSRIGVTCQNLTNPRILFEIPGLCFTPRPRVNVSVVQFVPRLEPQIPTAYVLADKVFRVLFHMKRRFLLKVVQLLYPKELSLQMAYDLVKHCGLDREGVVVRLSMEEFAAIAVYYEKQCRELPGLFLYDFREPKPLEVLANQPYPFPPQYIRPSKVLENIDTDGMSLAEFDEAFDDDTLPKQSLVDPNRRNLSTHICPHKDASNQ
ncbi:hypothetical protein GPALN_006402 [Globodera pallida]|nr:hypothetical protein GPALN_006402 [Globodera pallida]